MDTETSVNPYAAAPDKKKKLLLWGLYLCIFGSIAQSGTLSTMLPLAAADIGGTEIFSLASTISGVTSIVCMPLYGYIAGRNPHIKVKMMVLSFLIGAAILIARLFATNMWVIIVAMFFWGMVSPAIFILGYSIIRDMYDRKTAGGYLGTCGSLMMLATFLGPIGCGALMDFCGWRSLNILLLPFIVVGAIMIACSVKVTKEEMAPFARAGRKIDALGIAGISIFLTGLILGLSLGTNMVPFGTLWSNILFLIGLVGLIMLIIAMRKRQGEAVIPLPALKNGNVVSLFLGNFLSMFSNMALFFFLPSYIIYVMGGSAFQSGLAIAFMSFAGIFTSKPFGKYIGKTGSAKSCMIIMFALRAVAGAAIVLYLGMAANPNMYVVFAICIIAGVYRSLNSVAFSAGPQVQLCEDIRMQGNSVVQMGQNLGSGIAVAFYSVLIGALGFTAGFPVAVWVSVGVAVVGIFTSLPLKKLEKDA